MMPSVVDLLPHKPPMVLLDELTHAEPMYVETCVTICDNSPFYQETLGVPVHVGLEYMAQACGVYAGLESRAHGKEIRMGFLLGTRNYSATIQAFKLGDTLTVTAREVLRQDQMGVFDCTILLVGALVAQAQLTTYQADSDISLTQTSA